MQHVFELRAQLLVYNSANVTLEMYKGPSESAVLVPVRSDIGTSWVVVWPHLR